MMYQYVFEIVLSGRELSEELARTLNQVEKNFKEITGDTIETDVPVRIGEMTVDSKERLFVDEIETICKKTSKEYERIIEKKVIVTKVAERVLTNR